jgi:hypothetical protein
MTTREEATSAQPGGGDFAPPANPNRRAGRIVLADIYAMLLDPATRHAGGSSERDTADDGGPHGPAGRRPGR